MYVPNEPEGPFASDPSFALIKGLLANIVILIHYLIYLTFGIFIYGHSSLTIEM